MAISKRGKQSGLTKQKRKSITEGKEDKGVKKTEDIGGK